MYNFVEDGLRQEAVPGSSVRVLMPGKLPGGSRSSETHRPAIVSEVIQVRKRDRQAPFMEDRSTISPEREQELVAQVQSGDRSALGELLEAHQRRVYHVCLRMVGQPEDAAELTQETLLRAVQHVDSFAGGAKFSTWLIRIAMNQSISHLRKFKLRKSLSLEHQSAAEGAAENGQPLKDFIPQNHELSPELRVEKDEQLGRLAASLEQIDEPLRAVIVLRDLQGMDYQQIAETLEVPVGTVKSRLFRARLALRMEMERDGSAEAGAGASLSRAEVADG